MHQELHLSTVLLHLLCTVTHDLRLAMCPDANEIILDGMLELRALPCEGHDKCANLVQSVR